MDKSEYSGGRQRCGGSHAPSITTVSKPCHC